MATCYRHPNRETGVSCANCGKPICPDCMTATPVGMRCPDCSRQRTPVHTLRSMAVEMGGVVGLRLYVEQRNRAAQATYLALGMHDSGYSVMEEMFAAGATGT